MEVKFQCQSIIRGIYLWCQKLWCATEGASSVTITHSLLAQPKVCNLDIALCVQEQVVQLEIPVGEQVGQGQIWTCGT